MQVTFGQQSLIIKSMRDLVSGSVAATIQFLRGLGAAVVFIAVYTYWRWLPQPHSFWLRWIASPRNDRN